MLDRGQACRFALFRGQVHAPPCRSCFALTDFWSRGTAYHPTRTNPDIVPNAHNSCAAAQWPPSRAHGQAVATASRRPLTHCSSRIFTSPAAISRSGRPPDPDTAIVPPRRHRPPPSSSRAARRALPMFTIDFSLNAKGPATKIWSVSRLPGLFTLLPQASPAERPAHHRGGRWRPNEA